MHGLPYAPHCVVILIEMAWSSHIALATFQPANKWGPCDSIVEFVASVISTIFTMAKSIHFAGVEIAAGLNDQVSRLRIGSSV